MACHGLKRVRPAELVPGTLTVITVRMNYLAAPVERAQARLDRPGQAYAVSGIYAHGRDYHKVLRNRLQRLAEAVEQEVGAYGYRVFTDSAPVAEVELGAQSGLGWRGKHTLLLNRWKPARCFSWARSTPPWRCRPTRRRKSIAAPASPAAPPARPGRSSRPIRWTRGAAFLISPSNSRARFHRSCGRCWATASTAATTASSPAPGTSSRNTAWRRTGRRNGLDSSTLVALFLAWSEAQEFNSERMAGSAIRRIGYERWLRNIAVAMGNGLRAHEAPAALRAQMRAALAARADDASPLVREHVAWALQEEQTHGA